MSVKLNIEKPNLTSYQKDILYNDYRFTITEASTKVGKTFSHIWWIFEQAHAEWNKPNYNHWWIAPIYSQTKIAFKRLRAKIQGSSFYKVNESNLIITTPIGTHIHFKSADKPDGLYGEDVYSAVFDEAPRAKFDSWVALRSTLTATRAKCKLIGNFGGTANWMHQLKQKAEEKDTEYYYKKITAWDAVREGILEEEEILQAQKDLPTKIFKQLYLAEEEESENMLCTYDAINDLWTNTFVEDGQRYITADIALHGSDKFVVFVWSGYKIIAFKQIDKCDAREVEVLLKSTAEKYRVPRSNITYDADGLGSFLRGYLSDAKPFNNGSKPFEEKGKTTNYKNLKSQCGYHLAKKINNSEVFIDCDIDKGMVIKELECLQSYNLDKEGKIQLLPKAKIKELIGRSPDILDAMLMRMYFKLRPKQQTFKTEQTIQELGLF